MAEIIDVTQRLKTEMALKDPESLILEIDSVISKYMDQIDIANAQDSLDSRVIQSIHNASNYFKRISFLISSIGDSQWREAAERSLKQAVHNEILILKRILTRNNALLSFSDVNSGNKELLSNIDKVLIRMDSLLEFEGKKQSHQERKLTQQLRLENQIKRHQMLHILNQAKDEENESSTDEVL